MSKKGKSRIAAEQEGILPTPNPPSTGLVTTLQVLAPSIANGGNVVQEENFDQGMATKHQEVSSHPKNLGQGTSSTSELEVTDAQENLDGDPPSELSKVINKQLLLSSKDFPPLTTSVASTSTHKLISEGNQSKGKQKIDVPLSPGKSPSPACPSKLAAQVKSIDGKIQITRQPSNAMSGSLPTDGIQAPIAEQVLLQNSEARLGIKAVAQVASGGSYSLQGSIHPKGLMQGLSASES